MKEEGIGKLLFKGYKVSYTRLIISRYILYSIVSLVNNMMLYTYKFKWVDLMLCFYTHTHTAGGHMKSFGGNEYMYYLDWDVCTV